MRVTGFEVQKSMVIIIITINHQHQHQHQASLILHVNSHCSTCVCHKRLRSCSNRVCVLELFTQLVCDTLSILERDFVSFTLRHIYFLPSKFELF